MTGPEQPPQPRWVFRLGQAVGVVIIAAILLALLLLVLWLLGLVTRQVQGTSLPAGPRDPAHPLPPARIGTALSMTSLGTLRVTTYCPTGSRTSSGRWPRAGDAATLDRGVPYGSVLWIDGAGTRTVADRIGHGSDVDLYDAGPGCTTYADRYGVQHLQVAVVHVR